MPEKKGNRMTSNDAARIQSTQAKKGLDMGSGGFAARAQAAAAHNLQASAQQEGTSKGGGKGGHQSKGGGKGHGSGHQSNSKGK